MWYISLYLCPSVCKVILVWDEHFFKGKLTLCVLYKYIIMFDNVQPFTYNIQYHLLPVTEQKAGKRIWMRLVHVQVLSIETFLTT